MSEENSVGIQDLVADTGNLYKEEVFTDMKAASIRRISPVKADGTDDPDRDAVYIAYSQVMTPAGTLPISAEIEAENLGEAFEKFPATIEDELQRLRDEVQKQQLANAGRGLNLNNLKEGSGGIIMP